jgi:hypothetical protein
MQKVGQFPVQINSDMLNSVQAADVRHINRHEQEYRCAMNVIAVRNFTHRARRVALIVFNGGSDEQRGKRQPRWYTRQLGRCIKGLVQRGQISREWRPVGQWLFRWQLAE